MSEKGGNQDWSIPKFRETISKIHDDSALQLQICRQMVCSISLNQSSKEEFYQWYFPEKGLRRFLENFNFYDFYNNLIF